MSGDFIADAVARARAQSKHPPKLNKPAARMPRKSLDERVAAKRLGRPTGLDGRARRRPVGMPSVGQVLQRTIREQGWQEELGHGWVFGHWPDLVGEAIAKHTHPEKVEGGVLYISCDHSSWATNLRYLQAQILRTIAEKIGDNIILELRIRGPKQHKNYEGPQWVKPQGSNDTYG